MNFRTLIFRSLRFRARAHVGIVLGAAVGSAALIGALVVGDSVGGSLRDLAVQRLGKIHYALASGDRFFGAGSEGLFRTGVFAGPIQPGTGVPEKLAEGTSAVYALRLAATASAQNGAARANQVQLFGVPKTILRLGGSTQLTNLEPDSVALNEALAAQLSCRPGDTILLRFQKPTALSHDAIISSRNDSSVALRLRVQSIVSAVDLGDLSLAASQTPPFNAFMRLDALGKQAGIAGRANMILTGPLFTNVEAQPLFSRLKSRFAEWSGKSFSFLRPSALRDFLEPAKAVSVLDAAMDRGHFSLQDFDLDVRSLPEAAAVELRTTRVFLEAPAVRAAHLPIDWKLMLFQPPPTGPPSSNHIDLLTYLVNQFQAGQRTTPYSMVTAAGAPWVPAEMTDDEILINQWLADDLQIGPGADLALSYFLADSGPRLLERTNHFRVRGVVPMALPYADRTLMPEFPGISKAESTHDWDAGFPLVHKIRDQDDKYWKEWRGTPKAFVTLAAGQRLWGNRFGNLTAIRFPVPAGMELMELRRMVESHLLINLKPAELGLHFEPVRAQALAAANQAQDFGQLFLGFSFFLILAALILMALLFQFGLEQRAAEVGTFLALGFTPGQVRRLLLCEGIALALIGGLVGMLGGLGYARAMLLGLATVWRGAVGTSALSFHLTGSTLLIGLLASVAVCTATIWLVLRKQARRPARELLAEEGEETTAARYQRRAGGRRSGALPRSLWIAVSAASFALGLIGWALANNEASDAETFFSAGTLFLIAGLGFSAALFTLVNRSTAQRRLTVSSLGLRGCTRRRRRSLATVGLLACGSFLIMAIGAFKLDATANAWKRSSGTGGFALIGQSTVPIVQDLNTEAGRNFFGLSAKDLEGVTVLPLRLHDGDEASCLNLNRAQSPRLLGVNPELLQDRGAFTFAKLASGLSPDKPWLHVQPDLGARTAESASLPGTPESDARTQRSALRVVRAIGDLNSIVWAMGRKVGDTLTMTDEYGHPFKLRLVGGLANSVLQGSLLISEAEFVKRFPGESGYRMFLIDAPSNHVAAVSATLTRALQDAGLELVSAPERLAAFNAVQNTYLRTFQILGGLGLLLGSAGLGVVVLRNVLERRAELALLQAIGFRRRTLHWLVLSEHGGLLCLGLAVGTAAALVAILPVLLAPGAEIHYLSLLGTLAAVFVSGLVWTWLATRLALHGELLKALRNE